MVMAMGTIVLPSCSKKEEAGRLVLKMTDAAADYLQVNVDIEGAEIHSEQGGWISLPVNAGTYDLLQLQNNVSVVLANNAELPAGAVSQLRLLLGRNNTVVTSAGTFDLKVPSGTVSGLKLPVGQVILPDKTTEILLDFDANASVVAAGAGYILKPVLSIKSVVQY